MRVFFSSIHLQVLLAGLCLESQIFGQQGGDFTLINDRISFGPVVLDETCAYCYWPKSSVIEPSITAIELATGQHRWTRPAKLAHPVNFRIEEGWLQFETTEGDPGSFRRPSGPKTFHLVNAASGSELNFPVSQNLLSSVDRTWVCQDRCLTPKGQLIDCHNGQVIGELGLGEHQTVAGNASFLAMTLIPDESNTRFERRILRKLDLKTMVVEREMELPLEVSWRIIATQGDVVVGRVELPDRSSFLSCINLCERKELWQVPIPKAVYATPCRWEGKSLLTLSAGVHGLIRPLRVDLETGAFEPDRSWSDPRLLLAWHQEAGQYADFVASNDRFMIGRWRYLQLSCVDPKTGALIWNHSTADHLIGRVFASNTELGDYLVAETKTGIDLISVATGHRNAITPEQVGLKVLPLQNYLEAEDESATDPTDVVFGDPSSDWLLDKGLLLGPLIPFVGWLFWSMIRR